MTLEKLKFLIAASKKETEKTWMNNDGLKYTNELLDVLSRVRGVRNFKKKILPPGIYKTKVKSVKLTKNKLKITHEII